MRLDDHPSVRRLEARRTAEGAALPARPLPAETLRRLGLEAGADDVGLVALSRPELDSDRGRILEAFPATRTLVAIVARTHPEPIRSPARSISNLEFHQAGDHVNEVARRIVEALGRLGIEAVNPAPWSIPCGTGPRRSTWSPARTPRPTSGGASRTSGRGGCTTACAPAPSRTGSR